MYLRSEVDVLLLSIRIVLHTIRLRSAQSDSEAHTVLSNAVVHRRLLHDSATNSAGRRLRRPMSRDHWDLKLLRRSINVMQRILSRMEWWSSMR